MQNRDKDTATRPVKNSERSEKCAKCRKMKKQRANIQKYRRMKIKIKTKANMKETNKQKNKTGRLPVCCSWVGAATENQAAELTTIC